MKNTLDFKLKKHTACDILYLQQKHGGVEMYNLKDLSMITGLTDRTLRNYLSTGILKGNKEQGTWQFTEEHIQAFLDHEYVKPAVKAKRNAILFDYLKMDTCKENTACIVLRLREDEAMKVSSFFCNAVNQRQGLAMTFDIEKGGNKVVLVGREETVFEILSEYHALKNA